MIHTTKLETSKICLQGVFALIGDTGGKVVGADDVLRPLNKMYIFP